MSSSTTPPTASAARVALARLKLDPAARLGWQALEPRIAFDAAGVAVAAEVVDPAMAAAAAPGAPDATADAPTSEHHALVDALGAGAAWSGAAPTGAATIVFIDSAVGDPGVIAAAVPAGAEIVVLDAGRDGLAQIAHYVRDRSGIGAIHIVSHGEAGRLHLGTADLDLASIEAEHADDLAVIRAALAADADLLLYGCDVADGPAGGAFLDALADATGADVAASTDDTGAAALGGDWVLEAETGAVDAATIDAPEWNGVLAPLSINATGINPTVIYPATVPVGGSVTWFGAGTVGSTVIDLRATVVSADPTITAGFATSGDDPQVILLSNATGGGSATIRWEIFATGTNTVAFGAPRISVRDVDGIGSPFTVETVSPELTGLVSVTTGATTAINLSTNSGIISASGTDSDDILGTPGGPTRATAAVTFQWSDRSSWDITYSVHRPNDGRVYLHDGDGDFTFSGGTSTTSLAQIDLDGDNNTAAGVDYATSHQLGFAPVPVVDTDVLISNVSGSLSGGTVILTNAQAGDTLTIAGVAGTLGTVPGTAITFTITGNTVTFIGTASAADYQTALQAVRFAANGGVGITRTLDVSVATPFGAGSLSSNVATSTITILNTAPVANPDSVPVTEDVPVSGSLVANDTDANAGQTLTVTAASVDTDGDGLPNALTLGTPTALTAAGGAAIGTLTVATDGSYSFAPAANYTGPVPQLAYSISDGNGGVSSSTLDLTITPVADVPLAIADSVTTNEDTPVTIDALANDADPDGTALTITAINGQPIANDGTAIVVPNGYVTLDAAGRIVFTPDRDVTTASTFSYTVADGNGGTAISAIIVDILDINDAPVVHINPLGTGEVVVVDMAVTGAASIIAALPPGTTVVTIPTGVDGVAHLATALSSLSGIRALHIVAHGTPGHVFLGAADLTATSIATTYAAVLALIGSRLTAAGDIMVYGCNFGQDIQAVDALALATGADVAASIDDTGAVALGGNWTLEVRSGTIETSSLSALGYSSLLAPFTISASARPELYGATGTRLTETQGIDAGRLIVTAPNDEAVGTQAVWRNAGLAGTTVLDIVAVITAKDSGASVVHWGINGDDLRIEIANGAVELEWRAFLAGTYDPVTRTGTAYVGDPRFVITDIDGPNIEAVEVSNVGVDTIRLAQNTALAQTTLPDGYRFAGTINTNATDQRAWVDVGYANVTSWTTTVIGQPGQGGRGFEFDGDGDLVLSSPQTTIDFNVGPSTATPNYTTAEDTPVVLSGISFADPDAGTTDVTVTLAVSSGTLDLSTTVVGGVTAAQVTGDGTGTITITAPLSAINTTLADANGLTFAPAANANGSVTLTTSINDNGNTGAGGPLSSSATANITVTPVNDAPVAAADTAVGQVGSPVTIAVLANDSDLDNALDPASVEIAGTAGPGQPLVVPGEGTWTVNPTTGALTFTPVAGFDGRPTAVSYTVADVDGLRSTGATVSITPLLAQPHLDLGAETIYAGTTAPGTGAFLFGHQQSNPADRNQPQFAVLPANVTEVVGNEVIGAGITSANYAAGTHLELRGLGETTLEGAILAQDYISMSFTTTSTMPESWITHVTKLNAGASNFTFAIAISTDGFNTATLLSTNNPSPSNGSPTNYAPGYPNFDGTDYRLAAGQTYEIRAYIYDVTGGATAEVKWDDFYVFYANDPAGVEQTFIEGGAPVSITESGAEIEDVFGSNFVSGTITLTNKQVDDRLLVAGTPVTTGSTGTIGGVTYTVTETAGTVEIALSGSATKADYLAVIQAVTFENTSQDPITVDRLVDVQLSNGTEETNVATAVIHVVPVNDDPVDGNETNTVTEDVTLTVPAASGLLSNSTDVDGGAPSVTGYTITGITGTQPVGSAVAIPGVGSVTIQADGSYSFMPVANYNGAIPAITYTVSDGAGGTDTSTLQLAMIPVDDPVTAVTPGAQSTPEDTPLVFSTANGNAISLSDPDDTAGTNVVATLSLPAGYGTLQLATTAGLASVSGNGTREVIVTGSVAAVNAALDGLSFIPVPDWNGGIPVGMSIVTTRPVQMGFVNAGFEQQDFPDTNSFRLTHEDNIPGWETSATDNMIEVWDSGFLGVPAFEGNQFVELNANQVSTLSQTFTPAAAGGDLTLTFAHRGRQGADTMNVTAIDLGADGVLGGGDDTVLHSQNYTTGNTAWQQYQIDMGTASGNPILLQFNSVAAVGGNNSIGNFLDAISIYDSSLTTASNLGISVTPVADVVPDAVTTAEDTPITFNVLTGANGASADSFEGSPQVTATTSPTNGAITVATNGQITYTPNDNFHGTDTFTYTVTSPAGITETTTVTVTVTPVNDAPVAVDDTKTLTEDTPASGNVLTDVPGADADPDGDPISLTQFTIAGVTGTFAAGDTAIIPGVGTLTMAATGAYTFTPAANYAGPIPAVTYTIDDAEGGTDTATLTLTITPVDDPATIGGTTDNAGAVAGTDGQVRESDLAIGSTPTGTGETAIGSFNVRDPDGIAAVTIGGTTLTVAQLQAATPTSPVVVTSPTYGELAITGFDIATGDVSYSYTLDSIVAHSGGAPAIDSIALAVTDALGNSVPGTLAIAILDDAPLAVADVDRAINASGNPSSIAAGNVVTGAPSATDPNTSDGSPDIFGADGLPADPVTGVVAGTGTPLSANVGAPIAGTYGTLTLAADGSYVYIPDDSNPTVASLTAGASVTDVFTYRLTDADGSTSTATLTVSITGVPAVVNAGSASPTGIDGVVEESDLPVGSTAVGTGETVTGSFVVVTDPEPIGSVTIAGTAYTPAQLAAASPATPITVTTPAGVLQVTGFDAATGSIAYTYTLTTAQTHTGGPVYDTIALAVTNTLGDTGEGALRFSVVDDAPLAAADVDSVSENGTAPATGNVVTGVDVATGNDANTSDGVADTAGADRIANPVAAVGAGTGTPVGGIGMPIAGTYGTLTMAADGSYSYQPNRTTPAVNGLAVGDSLNDVFTYQVRDADGDVVTATLTVTILGANDAPVVVDPANPGTPGSPTPAPDPANVIPDVTTADSATPTPLDVSDYVVDPEGEPLTYTATGLPAGLTLDPVTGIVSGTLPAGASQGGPNGDGVYLVTVTATDPDGGIVTTTVTYTVTNPAPVAVDDARTVTEDTQATGNVLTDAPGADSDPDGDAITLTQFTVAGLTGTFMAGQTAAIPGVGTLTMAASGAYTFTPASNYDGAVPVVTYTLADSQGAADTVTLTLTMVPVNDRPVVIDPLNPGTPLNPTEAPDPSNIIPDVTTVDGATPATIDVTDYIRDPEGNPLTYVATGLPAGLTLDPVTGIIAGTLPSDASQGGPNGDGIYAVTVTATDPDGLTTTTTITYTVGNPAPVAVDDSRNVTEDTTMTGNVLTDVPGADSDPDGDAITLTQFVVDGVTYTLGQTANLPGVGMLTMGPSGSFSFAPAPNFVGPVPVVTYTIDDGQGGTDTATLTLSVGPVNDPPVAADDTASAGEDTATVGGNVITGPRPGTDIDPDSAVLTVTSAVQGTTPLTIGQPFTTAGGGILTLAADGSYTFTPGTAYNGLDAGETATETITYTVADGNGTSDTARLVITIVGANDAPLVIDPTNPVNDPSDPAYDPENPVGPTDPANVLPDVTTTDGAALTPIDVAAVIRDPDGEPLTFALDPTTTPSWITIDPVTGVVTGTPPTDASQLTNTSNPGEYLLTVTATDPDGASVTTTVTLTILNLPPVAVDDTASLGEDTTSIGGNVLSDPVTGDADTAPDADPLTVTSAVQGATPLAIGQPFTTAGGGVLTLNANGSYSFTPGTAYNGLGAGETATETIIYTVSDGNGGTDTAQLVITINGANDAPRVIDPTNPVNVPGNPAYDPENPVGPTDPANIIPDVTTSDGAALTPIDVAAVVRDPDGEPLTFMLSPATTPTWLSIDPVTGLVTGTPPTDASQLTNTGTPGEYLITVLASDPSGAVVTTTVTLTIVNLPPVAVDDTASVGEDVTNVAGNVIGDALTGDADTAPDADQLTVTSAVQGTTPVTIGQPFTTSGGGVLTLNANGSYTFAPGTAYNGLDAGETATETITYTVADGNGGTDTAQLVITINGANDAPVVIDPTNPVNDPSDPAYDPANPVGPTDPANVLPDVTTTDGATLTPIDVAAVVRDPDGEPLTFSLDPATTPNWIAIDPVTGVITGTPPANASQGTNTGTPGEYLLTVTATDPDGAAVITTVTLTITNLPPVARDDVASAGEDVSTVSGNVIGDALTGDADTAPDADPLTVVSAVQGATTVTIGTPFTTAGGGVLTLNADGSYTFTPGTAYNGLDAGETATETITYTVADGNGGTDTAQLVITVVGANDAPLVIDPTNPVNDPSDPAYDPENPVGPTDPANVLPDVTTTDGAALTPIDVAAVIRDPDGEPLTFALDPTTTPSWITIDPVTGVVTGTPPANASQTTNTGTPGEYRITITATDPDGAAVTTTVTLQIANLPPVAQDDVVGTGENAPAAGNVLADNGNGPDAETGPDSDPIRVGGVVGGTATPTEGVGLGTPVVGSAGGTFTVLPNGSYTFDPGTAFDDLAPGETRTTVVTYLLVDGNGGSDTATLTVTVTGANDAPIVIDPATGRPLDPSVAGVIPPIAGNDSAPLTPISIVSYFGDPDTTEGPPTLSVDPTALPPGLTFDPVTGTFGGTPTSDASQGGNVPGEPGVYRVPVTATDSAGASVTTFVMIRIGDPLPVAVDDTGIVTDENRPITFPVLGNDSDPDGDPIRVTGATSPDGVVTVNPDGTLSFTPHPGFVGTAVVTYTITDDQGGTATAVAQVTVRASAYVAPPAAPAVPLAALPLPAALAGADGAVDAAVNGGDTFGETTDGVSADGEVLDAIEAADGGLFDDAQAATLGGTAASIAADGLILQESGRIRQLWTIDDVLGSRSVVDDWAVDPISGFSLRFGTGDATTRFVIDSIVRDGVLLVTFDDMRGERDGTPVVDYRVTRADGRALPDWLERSAGDQLSGRPQVGTETVDLAVTAILEDGSEVTQRVRIHVPTGEIQPLDGGRRADVAPLFQDQFAGSADLTPEESAALATLLPPIAAE